MTYGEMRKILAAVGARGDGRFTLKRAYGNDFCLNPRDDAGLEWEVELIDWRRGFRAHPAERTLFRLTEYADFVRFYPEFPETHPDLRPGRGARLGWRSNDPGPATAALLWPEVQRVMELVERAYPRWELRAIHGTTDLGGLRAGGYDGGTYDAGADHYLVAVACPAQLAPDRASSGSLPQGCYRDAQAHGRAGAYAHYALTSLAAARALLPEAEGA